MKKLAVAPMITVLLSATQAFAEGKPVKPVTVTGVLSTIQNPEQVADGTPWTPTFTVGKVTYPLVLTEVFANGELLLFDGARVSIRGVKTAEGFQPTDSAIKIEGVLVMLVGERDEFHLVWADGRSTLVNPGPGMNPSVFAHEHVAVTGTPTFLGGDLPGWINATRIGGLEDWNRGTQVARRARSSGATAAVGDEEASAGGGATR